LLWTYPCPKTYEIERLLQGWGNLSYGKRNRFGGKDDERPYQQPRNSFPSLLNFTLNSLSCNEQKSNIYHHKSDYGNHEINYNVERANDCSCRGVEF
jgi:hypothetical protein